MEVSYKHKENIIIFLSNFPLAQPGYPNQVQTGYPVNNGGNPQTNNGGYPQINNGYPQMNAGGHSGTNNGYPQVPPQDVRDKSKKKKKSKKNKKDKFEVEDYSSEDSDENSLSCFPKLKGDSDRQGFVSKVFGIMTVQVIFTAFFTYWIISDNGRMQFCQDNMWLYFV